VPGDTAYSVSSVIQLCEDAMLQSNPSPAPWAYSSIMVPMDLDPACEHRLNVAAALADRFSSRLIGIAAREIAVPPYFETPADGVASIVEIEERSAAEDIGKAEALFRRVVGTRERIEWRHALGPATDSVLQQARAADLIVVGRPGRDGRALGSMAPDGGDLVMDAGRPVLFVPPHVDSLSAKRIVIGWKDTREARRAVWDGLPFLKRAKEVLVVSVDVDSDSADDVAGYLGCHDVEACALVRPGSTNAAADEIVRIAQQEGADLIVCGAYGHSRTREWIFGGVTRDLLDRAPLCCLMTH
jgi:nucleotide-binding universal stress UspA family protein